jgi:hypothetical protein
MSNLSLAALAREAAALADEAERANAPAAFVQRLRRLHEGLSDSAPQTHPPSHRPDHTVRLYRPAEDQPSGSSGSACPHCGKKLP